MQIRPLTILTLFGCGPVMAGEPLEVPPREAETLRVMPRVSTAAPATDPAWLYRGSIRPSTGDATPVEAKGQINRRKIDLLRTLDKLRLFEPEDDLDFRGLEQKSIAEKLGKPEILTIPPRTAK